MSNLNLLELNLRLVGFTMTAIALLHATFPKRFEWKSELTKLSLLNRQMFLVHCFFIALFLLLVGLLCLLTPQALTTHSFLALLVSGGLCVFWVCRLFVQFCIYDPSLWRNKHFETSVHITFAFIWLYYVITFGWTFVLQLSAHLSSRG